MDSQIQTAQTTDPGTSFLLQKTLGIIANLTGTLEVFIVEEKRAVLHLEQLRQQVQQAESKCKILRAQIETTRSSKRAIEIIAQELRPSPIGDVPTEVLIQIFKLAIDMADSTRRRLLVSSPGEYSPNWTPLVLSQVCRRWRLVLTTSSSFWRTIEFHAMEDDPSHKRYADWYRFDCYRDYNSPSLQDLFIPQCTYIQLKSLCDTVGSQSVPYKAIEIEALEDPPGRWYLPALSAHEVTLYRTRNVQTTQFFTSLFQTATELTIYGGPPSSDVLPFALLKTLVIRMFCGIDLSKEVARFVNVDFMQLLNATPALKRLELDFFVDDDEVASRNDVHASHSCLTTLSVHFHQFEGGKGLFGVHLDLPALETLEFLSMEYNRSNMLYGDFVYKHLNPKRIILPEVRFQELPIAAELLRRIPTAHTLEVKGENSNDLIKFANGGYHDTSAVSILFSLLKVTTLLVNDADIEGNTLLELVRAKLQQRLTGAEGVNALEVIEMYDTPGVAAPDWWTIQGLLREG